MSQTAKDTSRNVLRQHLETDLLLGVKEIPIPMPAGPGASGGAVQTEASPAASDPAKTRRLETLDNEQVKSCKKCQLCETRTQTVFGQGSSSARLVFVGEAPGFEEDRQGLTFVGKAGKLLSKMIQAMGLSRDEVFICNVLKCRPPNNRTPALDEIAACSPYLFEQLQIIDPEVICTLGAPASQTLLATKESIGRLRGRFHDFYPSGSQLDGPAVPLMPTYHPAYLLRSPGEKKKAWADLQLIMKRLGLHAPT